MAKNTGRGSRAAALDPGAFRWMRLHGGLFGRISRACWRAHRVGQPCAHEAPHPVACYCGGLSSDLTCSTRWDGRVGQTRRWWQRVFGRWPL